MRPIASDVLETGNVIDKLCKSKVMIALLVSEMKKR